VSAVEIEKKRKEGYFTACQDAATHADTRDSPPPDLRPDRRRLQSNLIRCFLYAQQLLSSGLLVRGGMNRFKDNGFFELILSQGSLQHIRDK